MDGGLLRVGDETASASSLPRNIVTTMLLWKQVHLSVSLHGERDVFLLSRALGVSLAFTPLSTLQSHQIISPPLLE